jgi:glycosidase
MDYYGNNLDVVHLPFNFQLIDAAWNARDLVPLIARYEEALPAGGWPNWVLSNHDRPRIAARLGQKQARAAALLLLTLRGTPTVYYGDELGLDDAAIHAIAYVIRANCARDRVTAVRGAGEGRCCCPRWTDRRSVKTPISYCGPTKRS